jgi:hypothetical protein
MEKKDGLRGVDRLRCGIKLLFCIASNTPVNQHSNINDTVRILQDESKCEFILCSDLFMTASARFADVLLPAPSMFENDNFVWPWAYGNYVLCNNKVVEPLFESRFEWDWVKAVAKKLDYLDAFVDGKPDLASVVWHSFTVTQNGSYLVTGTDAAGHTASAYVSINCIDNIAPQINISPSTLRVRQETDAAALTDDLLLSGVNITDNVSSGADLTITLTGRPTQADLNTPGVYTLTITAADKAGNTRQAQRYIRVYSKNEPEVLVNGQKTDNLGTTVIIGSYVLNISVNIPDLGGEPYTVYIKQGYKTAGQMKRDATVIENGTYTVSGDGYYTLYIVRQNREAYLTRLYIER